MIPLVSLRTVKGLLVAGFCCEWQKAADHSTLKNHNLIKVNLKGSRLLHFRNWILNYQNCLKKYHSNVNRLFPQVHACRTKWWLEIRLETLQNVHQALQRRPGLGSLLFFAWHKDVSPSLVGSSKVMTSNHCRFSFSVCGWK